MSTPDFPDDLITKLKKAKDIKGFRFIHILAPCPVGWRYEERLTIELSRLAVHANIFPLYECFNGEEWQLSVQPDNIPVSEYLKSQNRFAHLTKEEIDTIQKSVDKEWQRLLKKCNQT